MKLKWYPRAKVLLQETARYIKKEFGDTSSKKFLYKVFHTAELLMSNPCLGATEHY